MLQREIRRLLDNKWQVVVGTGRGKRELFRCSETHVHAVPFAVHYNIPCSRSVNFIPVLESARSRNGAHPAKIGHHTGCVHICKTYSTCCQKASPHPTKELASLAASLVRLSVVFASSEDSVTTLPCADMGIHGIFWARYCGTLQKECQLVP